MKKGREKGGFAKENWLHANAFASAVDRNPPSCYNASILGMYAYPVF